MSQTFSLVCHETKQTLWIGQGHGGEMSTFYSGQAGTMQRLGRFLAHTSGKPLVLMEDESLSNLPESYEEFEEPTSDARAMTFGAIDLSKVTIGGKP